MYQHAQQGSGYACQQCLIGVATRTGDWFWMLSDEYANKPAHLAYYTTLYIGHVFISVWKRSATHCGCRHKRRYSPQILVVRQFHKRIVYLFAKEHTVWKSSQPEYAMKWYRYIALVYIKLGLYLFNRTGSSSCYCWVSLSKQIWCIVIVETM